MSRPEKVLCMDVYVTQWQPIVSSKAGEIRAPLEAKLDMDDLFDGRYVCLLDSLMIEDEGSPVKVDHLIFVVKKAARRTDARWVVDYYRRCKVKVLDTPPIVPDERPTMAQPPLLHIDSWQNSREPDTFSDVEEDAHSEGASIRWDASTESDEEPEAEENIDEQNLERDFKLITQDDKVDITRKLGGRIDTRRYVVFTSARFNQVTVYWEKREQRMHIALHLYASEQIGNTKGATSFTSTRSCRISYHGLKASLLRAERWQQWRSFSFCTCA